MNDHIRKCCDGAGLDSNWKPGFDSIYGQQLEKFAELIVKECISVVDKLVPPGYEDYPDYKDQVERAFRSECAAEIKRHFG